MPQISKIRIVNFSYNDGKRLIADELFDFADKEGKTALNSFINLKNGGGKSVLVQLMLQPIHPKAKVAGRKIESFFTKASDHCFVVIEWFKDNSTEKLMTGIAMASGESANAVEEDAKGRPVKYYTFLSHYSDYSTIYNIVKLPLSEKNGSSFVAASFNEVRDLARKSNGSLDYSISDDSRLWREKLAEYGIVQEEWKNIIEELNSVEGGMTEFFARFKESDQLINQLLIPTIEGKFGQSSTKEDDSTLSTMLIEHAKAYNKQKDLIREKEACQSFQILLSQINEMVYTVWNKNDDYEKKLQELTAFSNALCAKKEDVNETLNSLADAMKSAQKELEHIGYEKTSEDYYAAKEKLESARDNHSRIETELEQIKKDIQETNHEIDAMSCAKLYIDICKLESKLKAIQSEIKAKSENNDSVKRLNDLAFSVMQEINNLYPQIKEELSNKKKEYVDLKNRLENANIKLKNLQEGVVLKKSVYDRADEAAQNACNETDKDIVTLGIDIMRYFDGCYRTDEILKYKIDKDKKKDKLQKDIEKLSAKVKKLSERNTKIETENIELEQKKYILDTEGNILQKEFDKYDALENYLRDICRIYSLEETDIFHGHLFEYLKNQERICVAKKESIATKISILEDEIQAAENGYVHVPKRVIEYLDCSGIKYQTCEKYLNTIAKEQIGIEKCLQILKNYPVIAYGIIIDEKEKMKLTTIEREMEDWLPSMVPVFTHEQVEKVINVQKNNGGAIAFYSVEYFSSRESFIDALLAQKEKLEIQKDAYTTKLKDLELHKKKAEEMSDYRETSRQDFEMKRNRINDEVCKIGELLIGLDAEKKSNSLVIEENNVEIDHCRNQGKDIERWFEKYDDLLYRLGEEKTKQEEKSKAYQDHESIIHELDRCGKEVQGIQENYRIVERAIQEKEVLFGKIEAAKTELGDITNGNVIEGEWTSLIEQYRTLKNSQNKEIAVLYECERSCLDGIGEKKDALKKYNLPENDYITLTYDDGVFERLKQIQVEYAEKQESLFLESKKVNQILGGCIATYSSAQDALSEYGGVPLEMENIQGNYSERKRITKKTLKDLNDRNREESELIGKVVRFIDRTKNILDEHKKTTPMNEVKLEINIEKQYDTLSNDLKNVFGHYNKEKDALSETLRKEVLKEKIYQFNELSALKSFERMVLTDDYKGDKYFTLSEQVEGVIKATKLRFSQIETDLEEFNKSKSDLLRHCVFQGRRVYEGLRLMAKSSAVSIMEGKPRKQMIKIDIPDEIDTNVAEATIDAELDTGIQELVLLLNNSSSEADIMKTANRVIGSQTLLRKYIGKDNIRVDVYKIDLNPENAKYRTWRETQINSSGGEKLVSYFSLILSLLNYSRSDYGDINDKSLTSVLILDNPFGAVSSGHLLKPMFEIASHFRVQLICLSDLNKADITACFDNFIKATVKPLKYSSIEMLTHEGNEAIEHGFYRSEQISFF